jgi:uncharacterized protein (TIGR02284 family)
MNRVITASRENILVLDDAARLAKDPVRRSRLHEQSVCHSLMLLDIERHIGAVGGIVISRASIAARLRAFWRRLRGMFGRARERQAVSACVNAERRTEAAYGAALSSPLSAAARQDLERQSHEMTSYGEYLRGLL